MKGRDKSGGQERGAEEKLPRIRGGGGRERKKESERE